MFKLFAMIFMPALCLLLSVPLPAFADRLPVFVSIVPQKYFVQRIGGNLVDVQVVVQPGADPHTYEPKPSQMMAMSKSKIYFAIGVPFEKTWLEKFSAINPAMLIVHTDQGIEKIAMAADAHHGDDEHWEKHENTASEGQHEEQHDHDHGVMDPHTWLSPPLVKIQAEHILDALVKVDPANAGTYNANFKEFAAQIDAIDAEFRRIFAGKQGMEFMVFHPAWGYFARTYGLKQVPVEIEGKEPKPGQLKDLIESARAHNIKVIFVQPQFSSKSAVMVARAIGGEVVVADPLAPDWAANLRRQAAKFDAALR